MGKPEQKKFIAPKEVIDKLKQENSVVSPEFAEITPLIVAKVISSVANSYYPYVPIETLERLKYLPDRVIVTDVSRFNLLDPNKKGRKRLDLDGLYTYLGNYIIIKNPESLEYVWEKAKDVHQSWINVYGDENEARKAMGEQRFGKVLIHETVHGFHPTSKGITIGFVENGVNYYAREITDRAGMSELSLFDTWEADTYQSFLKKGEERVHRVFFGLESNPKQIRLLMDDYKKHALEYINILEHTLSQE